MMTMSYVGFGGLLPLFPTNLKRHPEADRVKPTASPAGNRPVRCFFVVAGYGFYFFP
jgi:hypothetical protein